MWDLLYNMTVYATRFNDISVQVHNEEWLTISSQQCSLRAIWPPSVHSLVTVKFLNYFVMQFISFSYSLFLVKLLNLILMTVFLQGKNSSWTCCWKDQYCFDYLTGPPKFDCINQAINRHSAVVQQQYCPFRQQVEIYSRVNFFAYIL